MSKWSNQLKCILCAMKNSLLNCICHLISTLFYSIFPWWCSSNSRLCWLYTSIPAHYSVITHINHSWNYCTLYICNILVLVFYLLKAYIALVHNIFLAHLGSLTLGSYALLSVRLCWLVYTLMCKAACKYILYSTGDEPSGELGHV